METSFLLNDYEAVFNSAPFPCILINADDPLFTVTDINEKYLNLSGYKKERLIGKSLFNAFNDVGASYVQVFAETLNQVINTKKAVQKDIVRFDSKPIQNNTKPDLWTTLNTPICDERGEVVLILHCAVDVSSVTFKEPASETIKAFKQKVDFYKSIFWQAPMGIGIWEGPDFITIDINPTLAGFYDRDVSELMNRKIFEVFPNADETWRPIMTEVYTTGKPYKGFELEVDLSNGKAHQPSYVDFIFVPHVEDDGKISGVIGVSIDVTKEVELRKTVENDAIIMKIAAESAKLGVWDIDLRSRMIHSSSYLWMIDFPLQKSEYTIKEFVDMVLPEDRHLLYKSIKRAVKNFNLQVRVKWLDDTIHWLQLTGNILKNDNQEPIRIVGTTIDISDTKELEIRKNELISTVSHELKTPVTSIKAIAQILERKFNESEDKLTAELLHKLVNQIKRLTDLIHDLLDASLIEGGKLQLKKTNFMFNELVQEIVTEIEKTFPSHKIVLEKNPIANCFNDKERIRQVIINLLTNAIKYSPTKDKVVVEVKFKDNSIHCSVQDFGVGIAKDKESQIFQRFYRIIDEQHYGFQGIGIGLYISKQIIERLHGKIWFKSTENKGTTFYFSIPCKDC
ncbi:MAG: ATP-binding protein [Sphingobacteriaceae bacterium]